MKTTGSTDAQLISAYLDGDERAFEQLYSRYRLQLYSYLNRLVAGRPDVVDDLFQQTWMKGIDNLESYRDQQKFLSWLLRIAHNLAMDHFRRGRRFEATEVTERIADEGTAPPGENMDRQAVSEALNEAIAELAEPQREVVELRRQGVSFKEIAAIQETSINTVLGRMHYAVKRMQRRFADWQ